MKHVFSFLFSLFSNWKGKHSCFYCKFQQVNHKREIWGGTYNKKKQSHDRKGRETTQENKAYFLYINQIEMARGGLIIIYV